MQKKKKKKKSVWGDIKIVYTFDFERKCLESFYNVQE